MRRRLFLDSAAISLLLTVMIFSTVDLCLAAYPGPDSQVRTGSGWRGDWVRSRATGWYYGQYYYGYGTWYSYRGIPDPNPYGVQTQGDLYFTWSHYYDGEWTIMQGSTSGDSYSDGGEIDPAATKIRCYTESWFYCYEGSERVEWKLSVTSQVTASA